MSSALNNPGHDALVTTMVVEDDDEVRGTLIRFLSGLGHEVVGASTAAEAFTEIRRRKVACVLLDVRLPDGSGVDLVPQILDHEQHAAVLMLTAVNDAHSAALCMQRRARD